MTVPTTVLPGRRSVVGEGEASTARIWSPSIHFPIGADRQAPVGIPIMRDARIRPVLEHGGPPGCPGGLSRSLS